MPRQQLTHDAVISVITDDQSRRDLQAYFGEALEQPSPRDYTGGRFDLLGGGGDREAIKNEITAEDLIAVQFLSVTVPQVVALDLLEGDLGGDVNGHLSAIPASAEIGTPGALELLDGPADKAWRLLEHEYDMGWVTSGKILARKRPKLIPVYDRVVRCAIGRPRGAWHWFHGAFSENERELPRTLARVGHEAGVDSRISELRLLDVILWMRHHNEHHEGRCAGIVSTVR